MARRQIRCAGSMSCCCCCKVRCSRSATTSRGEYLHEKYYGGINRSGIDVLDRMYLSASECLDALWQSLQQLAMENDHQQSLCSSGGEVQSLARKAITSQALACMHWVNALHAFSSHKNSNVVAQTQQYFQDTPAVAAAHPFYGNNPQNQQYYQGSYFSHPVANCAPPYSLFSSNYPLQAIPATVLHNASAGHAVMSHLGPSSAAPTVHYNSGIPPFLPNHYVVPERNNADYLHHKQQRPIQLATMPFHQNPLEFSFQHAASPQTVRTHEAIVDPQPLTVAPTHPPPVLLRNTSRDSCTSFHSTHERAMKGVPHAQNDTNDTNNVSGIDRVLPPSASSLRENIIHAADEQISWNVLNPPIMDEKPLPAALSVQHAKSIEDQLKASFQLLDVVGKNDYVDLVKDDTLCVPHSSAGSTSSTQPRWFKICSNPKHAEFGMQLESAPLNHDSPTTTQSKSREPNEVLETDFQFEADFEETVA